MIGSLVTNITIFMIANYSTNFRQKLLKFLGLTNFYNDVDLFVHPDHMLEVLAKCEHFGYSLKKMKYSGKEEYKSMLVFNTFLDDKPSKYQFIFPHSRWTRTVYQDDGSVNGPLFSQQVITNFDLTICRNSLYSDRYYQR